MGVCHWPYIASTSRPDCVISGSSLFKLIDYTKPRVCRRPVSAHLTATFGLKTMEGRYLSVYNIFMGTRGFDRSVSERIAGRGVITLVKLVAVIN